MKGLIFTYVLTYGGALVSLFNPYYGFLIYVCFAIIRPEAMWGFAMGSGNRFSRIVAIGLLLGWVLNGFGDWRFGRARSILICFVGFCVWTLFSALEAMVDKEAALVQFEEYLKILLPFLVGLSLIRSVEQLKQLAWVIVLSHGYLAYEFNLLYWQWGISPYEWMFAAMDNNGIAVTMVAAAGLAFFMGLSVSRWWQKWPCLVLAALMVHVVLFSMSRGGMLALIITGVVTFIFLPKRPVHLLLFLIALLVGLRLAGDMVWERFLTSFAEEKDASAESRLTLWSQCIEVMLRYPLFGIGPRNWELVAPQLGWQTQKAAHTTWLNVGAEMGIPGLAFLALFYLICLVRLLRYTRERTPVIDPWLRGVARMVIASIIGFAVAAQFISVYGVEAPYYIVLLGAALLKLQHAQAGQAVAGIARDPTAGGVLVPPARFYPYPVRS